jgi:hypothetical protein
VYLSVSESESELDCFVRFCCEARTNESLRRCVLSVCLDLSEILW